MPIGIWAPEESWLRVKAVTHTIIRVTRCLLADPRYIIYIYNNYNILT